MFCPRPPSTPVFSSLRRHRTKHPVHQNISFVYIGISFFLYVGVTYRTRNPFDIQTLLYRNTIYERLSKQKISVSIPTHRTRIPFDIETLLYQNTIYERLSKPKINKVLLYVYSSWRTCGLKAGSKLDRKP